MYVYISAEKASALSRLMTKGEAFAIVGTPEATFLGALADMMPELERARSADGSWLELKVKGYKGDTTLHEAKEIFRDMLRNELARAYRQMILEAAGLKKRHSDELKEIVLNAFRAAYDEACAHLTGHSTGNPANAAQRASTGHG